MTLKECYRILELPKSADLDEIKRAYRRMAFALHPDLNPGMPDAARRFQEVNEAYVLLSKTLQEETRRDPRVLHRKPPQSRPEQPRGQSGPQKRSEAPGQGQAETQARARAQAQARAAATAAAQAAGRQGGPGAKFGAGRPAGFESGPGAEASKAGPSASPRGFTGSAGPSAERPKPGATAGAFGQAGPRAGQYGPSTPGADAAAGFDFNRANGKIFNRADSAAPAGSAYGRQEEVLGDILNDPFARRVFEDIYSELKKERAPGASVAPPQAAKPKKKKKLSLEWGKRKMSVDITHGFAGAVRAWLLAQLDQEQVLEMPAAGIVPGARLRLQVGLGLFGREQSVEVVLPPDYLPGAPIRLKGLGRKLGAWRGDLYLRVVPQGGRGA